MFREKIWTVEISYIINQKVKIFQNKVEKVQYKACLAITGAIQGTSRQKIYDELGLHTLIKRRWRSKLTFFYKIVVYYQNISIRI